MKEQSITILHLSDIQFGINHRFGMTVDSLDGEWDTLLRRLTLDLDDMKNDFKLQPDLIVISGDLVEQGKKTEFDIFSDFITRLTEHLKLDREQVIIVPGNHDINRKLCSSYFDECQGYDASPEEPYWKKWGPFKAFFDTFYQDKPKINFTKEQPWTLYELKDLKVVVAAINSTMKESHQAEDHFGYVGENQYQWFAKKLEDYKNNAWFRIVALHHNLQRGAKDDEENLRDSEEFKRILSNSANIVLHGHVHVGNIGWLTQKCPIIATGSAAIKKDQRPGDVPNQYQFIRITSDRLERWCRAYSSSPGQKKWIGDTSAVMGGNAWNQSEDIPFEGVSATFTSAEATVSSSKLDVHSSADYSPTNSVFYVPYDSKGDQVLGREGDLEAVRKQLTQGLRTNIGHTASFQGLGGLGKTQLAVEYAYTYRESYPNGVIWINADQDIEAQLTELAVAARWVAPETEHRDKLDIARHRLRNYSDCLLIFDNLEDQKRIKNYLPLPGIAPHILVTSRFEQPGFMPISIDPLDEDMALSLLLQESHRSVSGLEEGAAREIVRVLGGLPLAIELAGAYLCYRNGISFSQYLNKLRQNPIQALSGKHFSSFTGHDADLYATLKIDEELFVDEPLLLPILDLLTWSGPAQMGIELMALLLEKDSTDLLDALGLGVSLRLLQKSADGVRYSIHRLVREVRRQDCSLTNMSLTVDDICKRIGDWFNELREDFDKLPIFEVEADHLSAWLENAQTHAQVHTARLTWLQAYPPYHRGNYKLSLDFLKAAQLLWEKYNNQDRCLEAHLYIDIGYILNSLGNYRDALTYVQKSLDIRIVIFGNDHEDTATSYNYLGIVYRQFGNYQKCLELQKMALEIRRKIFGDSSTFVAYSYSFIGDTCAILGNFNEEFIYHEKALAIYTKNYGENNLRTAMSYGDLANSYRNNGDLENALKYATKSFDLVTQLVGEEHPQTAIAYNTLGSIYNARNENIISLDYATKAYDMRRALFGAEHPGTVVFLHNVSQCYSRLDNFQKAFEIQKYALEYFSAYYGEDHVIIAHYYESLGYTYAKLGNYKQGIELLLKASDIIKNNLGEKHPNLITIFEMLSQIYYQRNKMPLAVELLKKAVSLAKEVLPTRHPKTIQLTEQLNAIYVQTRGFRSVSAGKKRKK